MTVAMSEIQRMFDDLKGSLTFWVIAGAALLVALVALVRGGR